MPFPLAGAVTRRAWPLIAAWSCGLAAGVCGAQPLDVAAEIDSGRAVATAIRTAVESLGYADDVGELFVEFVKTSRCGSWAARCADVRDRAAAGKATLAQVATVENQICDEMLRRLDSAIEQTEGQSEFYHLKSVLTGRKSQCLGNCQLLFVLGNAAGLDVRAIEVKRPPRGTLAEHESHVATVVRLADGRVRMIDRRFAIDSRAFPFAQVYSRAGTAWDVTDPANPLGLHRRIRILDSNGLQASILLNIGNTYRKAGREPEADAIYRRGLELDPDCPFLHLAVAESEVRQGLWDPAEAMIRKAIEIDPDCDAAYGSLGRLMDIQTRRDEAVDAFSKAISLKPRSPGALEVRARLLHELGDLPRAVADLEQAAALTGGDPKLLAKLGGYLVEADRPLDAARACDAALAIDAGTSLALYNRGVAYAHLGRREEARRDLDSSVRLDPGSARKAAAAVERLELEQ
jgi:Tfp pilus assembly protein PilF